MADKIMGVCAVLGGLWIIGLNLWEVSYERGMKAGSLSCATRVIYRRGVDSMSPIELRRLANARERNK